MKVIKPQHLIVLMAPVKFGRQSQLGITAGFGFRLSDARILLHEAEVWTALETAPMSFKLLDEAMAKPYAEWLLAGFAVARQADAAGGAVQWTAEVVVGDSHKKIDCHQQFGLMRNAEGLVRLELDYANAYGGPDCPDNPVGRGYGVAFPRGDSAPSLTLPGDHREEVQSMAATGPLDTRWRQRAQFVSHKKRDLAPASENREHPGWPEKMDRRFFQLAPPDQWLATDNWPVSVPFSLTGMGKEGQGYRGVTPPLAGQLVVRRKGESVFEEVQLKRQTLWFFPDRDLGVILFNGVLPVSDMLSDELDCLVGALSEIESPHQYEHLVEVAARRLDLERNGTDGMRDDELLPPASSGWAWEYLLMPEDHPRTMQKPRPYHEVVKRMAHYAAVVRSAEDAASQAKAQDMKANDECALSLMRGHGLPPSDMDKTEWRKELSGWPRDKRRDDLVIRNADLSQSDFSGQSWQGVQFLGCDLSRCNWQDADLRNLIFINCQIDNAVFDRAVLSSCRFDSCLLTGSVWEEALLSSVHFEKCDFSQARLKGGAWQNCFVIEGTGSQFQLLNVKCDGVMFKDSSLPGICVRACQLTNHAFLVCDMRGLNAMDCLWEKCSWVETNMSAAIVENNIFTTCVFADGCDISASRWIECEFVKVSLVETSLANSLSECCSWKEVILTGVQADGSSWVSSDLGMANLMHAQLANSRWVACSLKGANLYGADLRSSTMTQCNLIGANLGFVERYDDWRKLWCDNRLEAVVEVPRRTTHVC